MTMLIALKNASTGIATKRIGLTDMRAVYLEQGA
jgi:hypothetical protein